MRYFVYDYCKISKALTKRSPEEAKAERFRVVLKYYFLIKKKFQALLQMKQPKLLKTMNTADARKRMLLTKSLQNLHRMILVDKTLIFAPISDNW